MPPGMPLFPDPDQQQQQQQQQHEKQQQQQQQQRTWGKKKRKWEPRVCNVCNNQTYEGGPQGCTTAGCEVNRPEMKERKQAKIDEEKANRHLQIALMSEQLQNLTKIMLARGGQVVPERPMPAWPEEEKAETDVEKPEDEKKQADEKKETADEQKLNPHKLSE